MLPDEEFHVDASDWTIFVPEPEIRMVYPSHCAMIEGIAADPEPAELDRLADDGGPA